MWRQLIRSHTTKDYFEGFIFKSPATVGALVHVERVLQTELPDQLRSLLSETNGISHYYGRFIWSEEDILKENLFFRGFDQYQETLMPFDHLLFFADAGNGDQFAFPVAAGGSVRRDIFVWNHEDDSRKWVAPSLETFVEWYLTGRVKV